MTAQVEGKRVAAGKGQQRLVVAATTWTARSQRNRGITKGDVLHHEGDLQAVRRVSDDIQAGNIGAKERGSELRDTLLHWIARSPRG
jgi:hypothetical protein